MGVLEGIRVVEVGGGAIAGAGAACGRIFAELGADVIFVEQPGGDPARLRLPLLEQGEDAERSLPFLYEYAGKRGVTARLGTSEGNTLFAELVGHADVVIDASGRGHLDELGVGWATLASAAGNAVWVSVTPYGLDGPHANWIGSDLTLSAAGGFLFAMGWSGEPPYRWGGELAYTVAGQQAAVGVLVALLAPLNDGAARLIDVSIAECVAAVCTQMAVGVEYDGSDQGRRPGRGPASPPADGIYPCADGHVVAGWGPVSARHWPEFIEWMAEDGLATEWVGDERWFELAFRMEHHDEVEQTVRSFFALHTMDELCDGSIPRGFMLYPLQTVADLAHDPQLRARDWFQPLVDQGRGLAFDYPGPAYRFTETPARMWRSAPRVGEHNVEVYTDEFGRSREGLAELAARGVI